MSASAAQRFAAALARARTFLEEAGCAFDVLRLDALRGAVEPAALRAAVAALQRPDGSFAAPPGRVSAGAVADTLEMLGVLRAMRVTRGPEVERAAAFLAAVQDGEGAWEGSGGVDAPECLATTGLVAGVLGASVHARPETLDAASDHLAAYFTPDRLEAGSPRLLAGYAACFANVAHPGADEVLQWCGRALEKGFRAGTLRAAEAARVLMASDAVALPGAALRPDEVVLALLAEQQADGGWPAWDGRQDAGARAAATLEAVRALLRLPS